MNYYGTNWPINTAVTPLTYLRLDLPCMDTLLRLISTTPLSDTLRQLHVKIGHSRSPVSISNLSIRMNSLHTFSFVQTFFSTLTIEWTIFEMLTSSNVMPILRRANVSIFIDISDLNRIGSSPLFTDYRHVDVHFGINLINCPQYINVTQYIPRGNRFHPREIVSVTFLVKHVSNRLEWLTGDDPFNRGSQYHHHMWYTLPWGFDEFFYEYLPEKWIIKVHVFEKPEKVTTIGQSSLRTFDASSQMWPLPICSLPHVVLSDCIETLNLSYYNTPIPINFLSTLRNITLANSINCLNDCSLLPITIRSIRILLFYTHPNYMLPNWPVMFDSLSKLSELTSLRIFMYDLPKTIDDRNCQTIAKAATLFSDFGFYFRYKFDISDGSEFETIFNDHAKFITQLCHCILSLCLDKQPYYSVDNEHCGLTMWF
ncbi:unnamed protein product [Rotaria sordida]|uniref:Uncharacterized protein n=2 Tax=Rotaria sordida TaxID=392033 RepID=A0A815E574_9BILA|nr:unnamed protein product [Rotaria sordida]